MLKRTDNSFWRDAVMVFDAVTPTVAPTVVSFGAIAAAICGVSWYIERVLGIRLGLDVAPHEIAGASLGLLLVLRTNAGYDRWWEARRLWGGITNQSRNLAIDALAYGPRDPGWRDAFVRCVSAFPHVARSSLRSESQQLEVAALLGQADAERLAAADHMPSSAALKLAILLQEARDRHGMDGYAFLQFDKERALLIEHVGACERILNTPLPAVYSVKVRRFIALFLLTLPFALLHRLDRDWLIPLITMMVGYPLISLDQIGIELQNPFSKAHLSHLPLETFSAAIERNVHALAKSEEGEHR